MALRRKKRKSNTKRISFKAKTAKKKKRRADRHVYDLTSIVRILAMVGVFAAIAVGFAVLDRYVQETVPASRKIDYIELINPPNWLNQQLKDKIYAAATSGGQNLKIDEDAAQKVQENLQAKLAWLHDVKTQITAEKILVRARYRKPIALVKLGLRKFYVDAELVILDFVPMANLPIVEVEGLSPVLKMPAVGQVWKRDDLAAAVAILTRLDKMDRRITPEKPLLSEIESIDVSNFKGREDKRFAHIVLYAKDRTEVIWGAEVDAWAQHFEAKDEEKLAKLYNYYKERGSLLHGAKYINLRDPQGNVPLPIDEY
jgi:hypothetical protein